MNRLTAWALHAVTLLLTITGIVYAAMHYLMEPVDPFAVVNHPLEPYMLKTHIVVAPALVLLIGIILHSHILLKAGNGVRSGRKSGLVLAALFGVMVLSGHLLQVFTSSGHRVLLWIHLGSGSLWALGYASHQVASVRAKRLMAMQRKGAVIGIALALVALLAAGTLLAETPEPFERQVHAMGTNLRIVVYEQEPDQALEHSEALLRVVEETEQQLSTWRNDSELSRLNRHPISNPFPLSPALCDLLKIAKDWVEKTEGAFDPGVGALADAWDIHGKFRVPGQAEIDTALAQTGLRHLALDTAACTATRTRDLKIDPGAFGKGEALDRANQTALRIGIRPLFLDFGGQVTVQGHNPGREPWIISIADPVDRSRLSSIQVSLTSGSLSTSGGSERDGDIAGKSISHILDPRSGQPVAPFGSVTVWRQSALEADILSTALYVMGPENGRDWAENHEVAACFLLIGKSGIGSTMTSEFKKLLN